LAPDNPVLFKSVNRQLLLSSLTMGCAEAHVMPASAVKVISNRASDIKQGAKWPDDIVRRNSTYYEAVTISGAERLQPKSMGVFMMASARSAESQDWRPSYRNREGRCLFYCAERRLWVVSRSVGSAEVLLESSCDVVHPEASRGWNMWHRGRLSPCDTIKVTAHGLGELQPNKDGITRCDFVCTNSSTDIFQEGDRGRVVAMIGVNQCKVQFEGRSQTFTVATYLLHRLPETISTDDFFRSGSTLSLPRPSVAFS